VSRFGKRNATTLCAAAGVLLSACIVVSPLDDFPDAPGAAGRGGSAGGNGSGGSKAGRGGAGGTSGAGGDAGAGANSGRGGSAGTGASGGSGGDSGAGTSGDAGEAGRAGAEGCSTNRECVLDNGEPYRCRPSDRRCVALKTSDCPLVYPDVEDVYSNPDALYIGGFATLAPVRYDENSVVWAQRLAIEELSGDNVNGLPGVDGGRRRPLVMIVCNNDTAEDSDTIDRGMRHLTTELEVPALVATLKPGDLVRSFEDHQKGKVFFLDPVSATSIVGNYDDDDLIWTMLGPPKDYAPGYRELLELTEAYIRRTRVLEPADRKIKVAHVTSTDAFNEELKNFVEPLLRFNGDLDVTQNGPENYLTVTINTALEPQEQATQIFDLAAQVRAFRPDVVISTAGPQFSQARGVLEYIETLWDDGSDTPRPFILLSPYNAGNTRPVVDLIESEMKVAAGGQATDPDAYKRFVGLSAAGAEDLDLQNGYASRLAGKFGTAANPDTGNYYDAVYFLAYSIVGSGAAVPTAPQIAKGMRRLIAGDPLDVGPTVIADVFDALADSETSIELQGTLGPPDFDVDSGVRIGTSSVFCFFRSSETPSETTVVPRIDVLRYDRDSAQFVGNFPCFDFMPP
jgi:hypothetical protein